MADDPNPQLRAELNAALTVLNPQIRGLHDLAAVSISGDLEQVVAHQIAVRERRRDLIQAVLNTLDHVIEARTALEVDGYPALASTTVEPGLFAELQGERSDLLAAVEVFKPDQAASLAINLGEAQAKPTA